MPVAFFTFAISSIFSPGPVNIAASAFGQRLGYRKTLRFLIGMAICFSLAMVVAGLMAETLRTVVPIVSPILRWVGAAYMVWLAVSLFLPAKKGEDERLAVPGLGRGFFMILSNPKLYFFALAIFASFGADVARTPTETVLVSLLLGGFQFAAASLWTLLGMVFSRLFNNRAFSLGFTIAMAALLVLSAAMTVIHG